MEVQTSQQQAPSAPPPAAPASPSVETSAKPEQQNSQTEQRAPSPESEQETPQRRESRRQRQLNRERNARIAAETELRLLKEQQAKPQTAQPAAEGDEPKREQFNTYEDFIEARATWKAEKAAEARARKILDDSKKEDRQAQTAKEHEAQAQAWQGQVEKARDEIDDFDDVMLESSAAVTGYMTQAIVESDKGALIAYHLAKNPQEAERISKLSPSKQAAAIVALEDKVSKPVKQPSAAPEPITPVGTKAEVHKRPEDMTDAEYSAWRRKQRQRG